MSCLTPAQIICLEATSVRLYGEVIQIVPDRGLCWMRPWVLVQGEASPWDEIEAANLYDVRSGSDLMLPIMLFRGALDTEVLPLISFLFQLEAKLDTPIAGEAKQAIQSLVQQVCDAHPQAFEARSSLDNL